MKLKRLLLPSALLALLLSVAFFARATCNPTDTGTAGNDTIVCDVANQPAVDVEGQGGDDVIIIDTGVNAPGLVSGGVATGPAAESGNDSITINGSVAGSVLGDSSTGTGSGSDIIVNNGTVTGAVVGDAFDGTSYGSDVIINNGTVTNSLHGDTGGVSDGAGNDVIINNGTVTQSIYGDAFLGTGTGSDVITNNGLVYGAIVGDASDGASSGSDVIVNNGTVINSIHGDTGGTADGSGGDVIINNGTIAQDIYGDAFLGNGTGSDAITNNGSVTNIYGDDYNNAGTGNDTITNNGTVNNINAGGGSDTVVINGTTSTVNGTIDGGTGYDVLTFNLTSANPDELRSWAEQIAAANPAGGTLTFNGHTYTWVNFEELTRLVFSIARINLPADPLAVFCSLQGGIDTYAIVGQQGTLSLGISAQQLSNGLAQAQSSGDTVLVGQSATSTVYALATGEVQVNTPGGFTFRFRYEGYCGALPLAVEEVETPVAEEPPFTIINQPYGG
ncbi:MAG: hypothetical protein U0694_23120 [Anaerolineae bacterium]